MSFLTLLITVLFLPERTWTSDVIKVGVLLPVNGNYPFAMRKIAPALQLAINNTSAVSKQGMELVLRDSRCSEVEGPLSAVELYTQKKVHVFIGPACDYALAPVARYSPRWGIPVLTAGAMVSAFSDKSEYKLLTRLHGSYSKVGEFFVQILKEFNWKHIGLVYSDYKRDPNRGKSNCFFIMEGIYLTIKLTHNVTPWHLSVDINKPQLDLEELFNQAREKARVLVLCAAPNFVRSIITHAHDNSPDGEFVFFNVDLFDRYNETKLDWHRKEDTPEMNEKAKRAYEALMTVTIREPTTSKYETFSNEVKIKAKEMYPDLEEEYQVNSFAGAFHDAIVLYRLAVQETLDAGGNISDGAAITKRMWNRTFEGVTGTVCIDENGDRDMDFSLLDMNPETGIFEVVAEYFGNKKLYEPVPGKSVHWARGRTSVPPDTPPCGFDGSKCPSEEPFPKYGIVLIVLGSFLVLAVVAIFLIYRWKFSNYYTMDT